jgi:hypothetical protein
MTDICENQAILDFNNVLQFKKYLEEYQNYIATNLKKVK